MFFEDITRYVL